MPGRCRTGQRARWSSRGRTSPASYTTNWVRSREPSLTMWRRRDATPPPGSETERPQDGATIPRREQRRTPPALRSSGGVCGLSSPCARWASRPTQILPKRDSVSGRLQAERPSQVSPVECRPLPGAEHRAQPNRESPARHRIFLPVRRRLYQGVSPGAWCGMPVRSRSQTAKGSHPRRCLTDWRYSHSMASLRR